MNLNILSDLMSGLAHIQAGRLPQALSAFDEQGRAYKGTNEIERAWRRSLEGEIALARGDLQQAASAFSASEPSIRIFGPTAVVSSVLLNDLPSRDGLARVAIARGDLDGAIKIYRDLLRYGPHSKWVAPFEPLYVLQIARLLEKKGDRKTALDEYQRFLNLWKNADAGLPQLAEARRAVSKADVTRTRALLLSVREQKAPMLVCAFDDVVHVVFEQVTLLHQFLRGRRDQSEIAVAALIALFDGRAADLYSARDRRACGAEECRTPACSRAATSDPIRR